MSIGRVPKNLPKYVEPLLKFIAEQERVSYARQLAPVMKLIDKHWPEFASTNAPPPPKKKKKKEADPAKELDKAVKNYRKVLDGADEENTERVVGGFKECMERLPTPLREACLAQEEGEDGGEAEEEVEEIEEERPRKKRGGATEKVGVKQEEPMHGKKKGQMETQERRLIMAHLSQMAKQTDLLYNTFQEEVQKIDLPVEEAHPLLIESVDQLYGITKGLIEVTATGGDFSA